MATRVVPGFAFSLVTDLGFAVGVVSHRVARTGDLVRKFPRMRGGARALGWTEVDYSRGTSRIVGKTRDASLPIAQGVNMTALKEMIITGYRPADDW